MKQKSMFSGIPLVSPRKEKRIEIVAFLDYTINAFKTVEKSESESESEVAQSCPTVPPVDCSPPNSSVHGILQARILEWIAISFSRGSSRPRD